MEIISTNEPYYWPNGFTMSDNRVEENLARFLSPEAYMIYRQVINISTYDEVELREGSIERFRERTNMKPAQIKKAIKELLDKKFIVKRIEEGRVVYYENDLEEVLDFLGVHVEPIKNEYIPIPVYDKI